MHRPIYKLLHRLNVTLVEKLVDSIRQVFSVTKLHGQNVQNFLSYYLSFVIMEKSIVFPRVF